MANQSEKKMLAAACRYAYSRFVLNYDMFYETMVRDGMKASETIKEIQEEFQKLIGAFLRQEPFLEGLDQLRNRILQEMEVLTAYVEYFDTYEYVLNRIENRFSDGDFSAMDDEELVDRIMEYIVSAGDTALQNERIRTVLGQLPMRFTKAKFFSIFTHALSVYEGTGKKNFSQVLDLLRQEALISLPRGMEEGHEKLHDILELMQNSCYRTLDQAQFKNLKDGLALAEEILLDDTSDGMMMVELVNDFYVIGLTRQETLMDNQEEELYHTILSKIYQSINQEEPLSDEEMDPFLVQMEGRQERYYEQWSRYELKDLELDLNIQKGSSYYESLQKVQRLLSTSSFMDLDVEEEEEEEILLSKKAVEEMCGQLCRELEQAWKPLEKPVVHAFMAKLLSKLPMFFSFSDEIREFVGGCLSACTDGAEKAASVELICDIMESDNALV